MRRFSRLKNWWHTTPINFKCIDIYVCSSIATFWGLFTGNMYHSTVTAYNANDCVSGFMGHLVFLGGVSALKSLSYAVITPLFVPYALTRWLYFEPEYVRRKSSSAPYEWINRYGLWPHFIPFSFSPRFLAIYKRRGK